MRDRTLTGEQSIALQREQQATKSKLDQATNLMSLRVLHCSLDQALHGNIVMTRS